MLPPPGGYYVLKTGELPRGDRSQVRDIDASRRTAEPIPKSERRGVLNGREGCDEAG